MDINLVFSGGRLPAFVLIRDIVRGVIIESLLRTPIDPWITIARTTVPGSDTELTLSQRNEAEIVSQCASVFDPAFDH